MNILLALIGLFAMFLIGVIRKTNFNDKRQAYQCYNYGKSARKIEKMWIIPRKRWWQRTNWYTNWYAKNKVVRVAALGAVVNYRVIVC